MGQFTSKKNQIKFIKSRRTRWSLTLPQQHDKNDIQQFANNTVKIETISTPLRQIGIPLPIAPPGESLCIKTGNQIGGRVYSRFNHVIHGGPKYTNFLASGRGMFVD